MSVVEENKKLAAQIESVTKALSEATKKNQHLIMENTELKKKIVELFTMNTAASRALNFIMDQIDAPRPLKERP